MSSETPDANGSVWIGSYYETPSQCSFRVESDTRVRLRLRPRTFPVKAGGSYLVVSSYFAPFLVKAGKDGEMDFELDAPRNCTVFIEEPKSDNLLPNASFEAGPGREHPRLGCPESQPRPAPSNSASSSRSATTSTFPGRWAAASPRKTPSLSPGLSASAVRGGKRSLALCGDSELELAAPLPLDPGKEYLFEGYYHLENLHFGGAMRVAVVLADGKAAGAKGDSTVIEDGMVNPLVFTDKGEMAEVERPFQSPGQLRPAGGQKSASSSGARPSRRTGTTFP